LKLNTNISPEALDGLEEFSHIWIIFKFHLNTNTLKESKAFSSRSTFNAKITLPMLKKKMGVFATRSPHRPNPFGITMARIERVCKKTRTVYLSSCDLVDRYTRASIRIRHMCVFMCVYLTHSIYTSILQLCISPTLYYTHPPDSTPVYDIKPYVPAYDTTPDYRIGIYVLNPLILYLSTY
jgi:tRNA (Thr-GGU) A37 N-methylase